MTAFDRELRDRIFDIEVGGISLRSAPGYPQIRMRFDIAKSTRPEPNTCSLWIYNLSRETVAQITRTVTPRVVVRAGHLSISEVPPILFVGDARKKNGISSYREGVDTALEIHASDKGDAIRRARLSRSYPAGTRIVQVLRDAVDTLGVGRGNLSDFEAVYRDRNGRDTFPDGFTAHGPARHVVDTIARSAGLRWSVQNGNARFLRVGNPLQRTAVRLAPGSGLIGSPTRAEKGKVTCQALIQPGLEPGMRIVLAADFFDGEYEIRRSVLKGSNREKEFYATLELAPLR